MRITHKLNTDLSRQPVTQILEAVQGDANTRAMELHLLSGGAAWNVPAGVTAAVAFRKPDGHKGLYDTLPDGSAAVTISGSTVTAILAPQVLSCAGDVAAAVVLSDENLNRLAAFPVAIHVAPDPSGGAAVSNDYYRYSTMEAVNTAMEEFFAAAEGAQAAFIQRTEGAQASFLDTAGKALEALHAAVTEEAPAIVCDPEGELLSLTDASDRPLRGLTLYGRTTQNGTPSPEAPVDLVTAGAIYKRIKSYVSKGKNLFGGEALADVFVEKSKGTKNTEAGTVSFAAGQVGGDIIFNGFKPNTRYTIIMYGNNSRTDSSVLNLSLSYTDGTKADTLRFDTIGENSYMILTTAANKTAKNLYGTNYGGTTTLYYDKCGIFEGVLTEADFVPYEGQTLTVSTPNGLPGLEVKNAAAEPYANYTDAEGKKWICDEIDFVRGVYVQRIASIYVDGSQSWRKTGSGYNSLKLGAYGSIISYVGICTHLKQGSVTTDSKLIGFQVTNSTGADMVQLMVRVQEEAMSNEEIKAWAAENPFTLLYALTTPIETPLSAEELAQYAALHSNKPNTTVYNDGNAGMAVAYVADTKTYIDQKLAAISAAMLNA